MESKNRFQKLFRILYLLLGFIFGYQLGVSLYGASWFQNLIPDSFSPVIASVLTRGVCAAVGAVAFNLLIPTLEKGFERYSLDWIRQIRKISPVIVAERILAMIIGLIMASLISSPIYKLDLFISVKVILVVLIYAAVIYFVNMLCANVEQDVESFFNNIFSRFNFKASAEKKDDDSKNASAKLGKRKNQQIPKILDTSVIIDGRISDILATGFIDGPVVIPSFVVEELQFVSDSADPIKRNRGRAGLDLVNALKDIAEYDVVILDKDYPDLTEVDSKLIRLAKDLKGKVITNDYNLNKVSEIQGISVLNINDLSNAVKTVVLPGEKLKVHILREGKENNQGIAYHEDGTMVVVENGKSLIGRDIAIEVTSVLQTSAGRMIFAKPVK